MADVDAIRNVDAGGGRPVDVVIARGIVERVGPGAAADMPALDGGGRRLIAGLTDHHLHLFAAAAAASSLDLSDCAPGDLADLRDRLAGVPGTDEIRAIGLDDGGLPLLDRAALDSLCAHRPVRIQYRTGRMWVRNSLALARLGPGGADPRHDAPPPSLHALGRSLARWGVTAVTDASVTTDRAQAKVLARAAAEMPQRLLIMGDESLDPPSPLKILLDEPALPDFEALVASIRAAHDRQRIVATHCVTETELVYALAALAEAGVRDGDRIEHGALIPEALIPEIAAMGLVVVTQPGFIAGRGDRYRQRFSEDGRRDLYRLRSLIDAGVRCAGSSDAPYGPLNPWVAMDAAMTRRTAAGHIIGADEAVTPEAALALWSAAPVAAGTPADLVLLRHPPDPSFDLDPVDRTWIGGKTIYRRDMP